MIGFLNRGWEDFFFCEFYAIIRWEGVLMMRLYAGNFCTLDAFIEEVL